MLYELKSDLDKHREKEWYFIITVQVDGELVTKQGYIRARMQHQAIWNAMKQEKIQDKPIIYCKVTLT